MAESTYDLIALRFMTLLCASCWAFVVGVWVWMSVESYGDE